MLADGVNSKQARIRVVGIEGRSLQQSKTDTYKESLYKVFFKMRSHKEILTSKGWAVTFEMAWLSLLVVLEPLLTWGPAPSTCCSMLNAVASADVALTPSLATTAWTSPAPVWCLSSPGEHSQRLTLHSVSEAEHFSRSMPLLTL